jgi:Tfp pilus assembly protein PilF
MTEPSEPFVGPSAPLPAAASSAFRSASRVPLFIALGLAALVLFVYWGSGAHGFVNFDDGEYVAENPNVAAGLTAPGFRWALTAFDAANWHPVTWLSHMLDVQLFGMNPGAFHRMNVAFHVVNTILLFLVLRNLTGAAWRSAFVAGLFGVHPLHVESVAWIAERKDVLSTLFLFLTIAGYAAWVRDRKRWTFALALVACALGLMAKPMLVTTPVLLLLLDFWPLRRFDRDASREPLRSVILEKVPFVVLAGAAAAATWLAQSRGGAMAVAATFAPGQRIANALVSYVRYLGDTIWPSRLAVFYPHPSSVGDSVPAASWISAAALLAVFTWAALRRPWSRPWLAFGWTWYVVSLLPVIGLVQVGSQARADRYTYIPLIGIFAVIAWGAAGLASRLRVPRLLLGVGAIACVASLAAAARVQNGYWTAEVSLDTHAIDVTRANWVAWNNLGKHYMDTDLPRAATCFRRAIGYKENYDVAWYNLGVVLGGLRRDAEAIASYRRSLDLDPTNADGWRNLSFEYVEVGNFDAAVAAAGEALRIRPEDSAALQSLVISHWGRGDREGGRAAFQRLKAVDPAAASSLAARVGLPFR